MKGRSLTVRNITAFKKAEVTWFRHDVVIPLAGKLVLHVNTVKFLKNPITYKEFYTHTHTHISANKSNNAKIMYS